MDKDEAIKTLRTALFTVAEAIASIREALEKEQEYLRNVLARTEPAKIKQEEKEV